MEVQPEQPNQMQQPQQQQVTNVTVIVQAPSKKDQSLQAKMEGAENGVLVVQKIDLLEAMKECCPPCSRPIQYDVWKKDQDNKKQGKRMFKYYEKPHCCAQFATGSCKPFKMKVYNDVHGSEDDHTCMRCNKVCKCNYLCLNRASMECWEFFDDEDKGYLGRAYDPWDCCNYSFKLYGQSGDCDVDFTVVASCLQFYFWVNCPCDVCQKVKFNIYKGTSHEMVGNLNKLGRGCL